MEQPNTEQPDLFAPLAPCLIKPPGVRIPTAHEERLTAMRHLLLGVNEWVRRRAPEFPLQGVATWHVIDTHTSCYSLRIQPPASWCALPGHTARDLASAWRRQNQYMPHWDITLDGPWDMVHWKKLTPDQQQYGTAAAVLHLVRGHWELSAASLCNALADSLAEVALWGLWRAGQDQGLFAVDPLDPDSWNEIMQLGGVPMNLEALTPDALQRWLYAWLLSMRGFVVKDGEGDYTAGVTTPTQRCPLLSVHYTPRTWKIALARRNLWRWGRTATLVFLTSPNGQPCVDYLHHEAPNSGLDRAINALPDVHRPITLKHNILNTAWLRQLLDMVLEAVGADLLSVLEELGFSAPEHEEEDKHAYSAF